MGFETVKLKDLTINLDNKRKPLNELERKSLKKKGLYPYCGANGVLDYIDEFIFDQEILCIAEDGGSWGFREKCAYIINEPCWVNNHAHVLVAKENVNVKYLCYYLNYTDLSKHITGTTRGKLTKSALEKIEVKIPDYSTQNKIVNALDKAQELIDKRKAQIEALDQLTQSVFLEMFGDWDKNEKAWEVVSLESITNHITDGVHSKPEYTNDGIPFISVKDINTGKLKFENCKFISEETHQEYIRRCKPELGDILYTKVGATYGIPAIVDTDKEFSLYVSVALIKPKRHLVNSVYLREALRSIWVKRQADRSIKGIGVPDLHLKEIKKFKIILPPLDVQEEFAKLVQKVEKQRELLEKGLIELENNFNSLIQRVFKGELFND